ncbi:MAG: ribosomal protein S18-alanine N-acetyltransferase [Lachnospiraceae bacterium]|jgi:ribosomal-protein-alanine N-acetyltransferase
MAAIDKMTIADLDEAQAIEKSSFSNPWSWKSMEDALLSSRYVFIAARDEGKLIGFAAGSYAADQMDIVDIAVDWKYRQMGVGTALLKALLEIAFSNGILETYLEVRESNEAAVGLYKKFGFTGRYRRKDYYSDPTEDAIVMNLSLEQ